MNSYFRGKINVVLDLSNYATKTELEHATGINTSDIAAKRDIITLETWVDKLEISKLTSVPTTTIEKIFETAPVFMWNTALRGIFNLFSSGVFLLFLTKFVFCNEDCPLGYNSIKFFPGLY